MQEFMLSVFYFFGPFGENTLCVGFVWMKHLFISNDDYDDASGRVEGILKRTSEAKKSC